jgi:hypothetical protein
MKTMQVAFLSCLALLSACTSTEVLKTWKDESLVGRFSKAVVFAVVKEPAYRTLVEQELTALLRQAGVDAQAGSDLFPGVVPKDESAAIAAVRGNGATGIIVVRPVDTQRETVYTPGTVFVQGDYGGRYNRGWYGYYNRGYQITTTPGYSTEYYISTVETAVFDAGRDQRVWSTITETTETSPATAIDSYVKAIRQPLLDSGLF